MNFDFDDNMFNESDIENGSGIGADNTDNNVIERNNNTDNIDELDVGNPIKIAIIAVILGFILILIVAIIVRFSSKSTKEGVNNKDVRITNIKESETEQSNLMQQNINTKNDSIQGSTNTDGNVNTIVEYNSWIEFNSSKSLNFNNIKDSDFTVTEINNFVKLTNENTSVIKSVISGNISGLSGTYEIELPYYKASKLNINDIINITYTYAQDENNKIIIGEIQFK